MGSVQDIEVEGVTAFAPPPATSYYYIIELKNSRTSIWMEDRTSKKQWYKGGMTKENYVSSVNAIPDASAVDYVKCFQDTLNCELDNSSDAQRTLYALTDGALRLELKVTIRVFRATWVAKYTFDLEPVSVERIDILESKLRDQQEALEKLRSELKLVEAPPFIKLTTSQKYGSSIMCWDSVKSDQFVSNGLDGAVKALREGVYNIGVLATTIAGVNKGVQLLKNGMPIQVAFPGYSQSYFNSTTLNTIERLEKNDELTTTCAGNLAATSYLVIVRLGI